MTFNQVNKFKCIISLFIIMYMLNVQHIAFATTSNNNKSFYFIMEDKAVEKLIKGVESLSFGDDYQKIIEMLGKPSLEQKIAGKKYNSPVFYQMTYYTKKYEKDFANGIHDRYIVLILDENKKLKSIMSNIEGVQNRGNK